MAYKDGSFYEGQWKQGKREGNGTLYYTNGDVFQGVWKDDLKHGKVSSIYQEDLFLKFEKSTLSILSCVFPLLILHTNVITVAQKFVAYNT